LNCEVVIDSEGKPKGEFSAKELLQIFKKWKLWKKLILVLLSRY
jgi:hypothetical protein